MGLLNTKFTVVVGVPDEHKSKYKRKIAKYLDTYFYSDVIEIILNNISDYDDVNNDVLYNKEFDKLIEHFLSLDYGARELQKFIVDYIFPRIDLNFYSDKPRLEELIKTVNMIWDHGKVNVDEEMMIKSEFKKMAESNWSWPKDAWVGNYKEVFNCVPSEMKINYINKLDPLGWQSDKINVWQIIIEVMFFYGTRCSGNLVSDIFEALGKHFIKNKSLAIKLLLIISKIYITTNFATNERIKGLAFGQGNAWKLCMVMHNPSVTKDVFGEFEYLENIPKKNFKYI